MKQLNIKIYMEHCTPSKFIWKIVLSPNLYAKKYLKTFFFPSHLSVKHQTPYQT